MVQNHGWPRPRPAVRTLQGETGCFRQMLNVSIKKLSTLHSPLSTWLRRHSIRRGGLQGAKQECSRQVSPPLCRADHTRVKQPKIDHPFVTLVSRRGSPQRLGGPSSSLVALRGSLFCSFVQDKPSSGSSGSSARASVSVQPTRTRSPSSTAPWPTMLGILAMKSGLSHTVMRSLR